MQSLLVAALIIATGGINGSPCRPSRLSAKAAALLRPVLSESLAAHAEEFDASGRYLRKSPHSAVFERRFRRLLDTPGPAADEAIAALMSFYVGEHAAEELVCAALGRGKRMKPHLKRFLRCPPLTGLEPIDPFFTTIPNLREETLRRIIAEEPPCMHD